tara:strand:+ start:774 stop:1394 length:621 start_codon:yes stop_codon:yes gene_type:complete
MGTLKKGVFMIKFNFAGHDKNRQLHIIGIDLQLSSYQKTFDCSTPDWQNKSLAMAIGERTVGTAHFIDLRDEDIDITQLTQRHLHDMGKMYNTTLDERAKSEFRASYVAFAKSVCQPDTYFLSHQLICRTTGAFIDGHVSRFESVEEGAQQRRMYISENRILASTDLGGDVYRNGLLVGHIDFLGILLDNVPYGGQEYSPIDELPQ